MKGRPLGNESPQFLSDKVFNSPSLLKGNFTGYRILDLWGGFFSQYFKYSFHSFLACTVLEETLDVMLLFILLQAMCFFSSGFFQDFFLYLWFSSFDYNIPTCGSLYLSTWDWLNSEVGFFIIFGKFSAIIFQIFLLPKSYSLLLCDHNYS